jgi:hypothetical protein
MGFLYSGGIYTELLPPGWTQASAKWISNHGEVTGKGNDSTTEKGFLYSLSRFSQTYMLSVTKAGTGAGTITSAPAGVDCNGDCEQSYPSDSSVILTASADTGSVFDGWSGGGCSGTGPCSVTMNADTTIIAAFTLSNSGPDLTGEWVFLEQTCREKKKGVKCKIKGTLTIRNAGNEDAQSSYTRFYLSDDAAYDEEDRFLSETATGKVKAGKHKNKSLSGSFPFGISTMGKYIIAVIDADNSVEEPNETNNNIIYGPLPVIE